MKSRLPTLHEIDELIAFLPRLYAEGFSPVKCWDGGTARLDGVVTMPWPEYDEVVEAFYGSAARECWRDYGYNPAEAHAMLQDQALVAAASLDQIKSMLTHCVRGERFCDGHWEAMIELGHIRRLLERLRELRDIPS
jgi:hypothetical protein